MRLEQIVGNLLSNAVKYGAGRPVDVGVSADGATATLVVRDHGIGIPPEDLPRIFERFERAASSRQQSGFGLGLWIVRRLVDALGGRIDVRSAPDEGSTFRVELPRRGPGGPGGEDGARRRSRGMTTGPLPRPGVLVVEDDLDIGEIVRLILEAEGYPVAVVRNGREAIAYLQAAGPPCLILLDLMMPVMDGWQFRAEQRRDPAWAAVPVVVISADARVPQKASALGATGYLAKPIDFDALLATVKRYC